MRATARAQVSVAIQKGSSVSDSVSVSTGIKLSGIFEATLGVSYTHTWTHEGSETLVRTHAHARAHTHARTHTHTHTHTHAPGSTSTLSLDRVYYQVTG